MSIDNKSSFAPKLLVTQYDLACAEHGKGMSSLPCKVQVRAERTSHMVQFGSMTEA
jgi:hypothetical protein